jgi:hypothetical protein
VSEQAGDEGEQKPRKANVGKLAALGLVAFVFSIPMFVGVARGVSNGDVWDPVTGERVGDAPAEVEGCERDAALLMRDASGAGAEWDARRERWRDACAASEPELERMIGVARGDAAR